MEKFSQWRDKATGLHPFLAPKVTPRGGRAFYMLKVLFLGLPLAITRFLLSVPLFATILLLQQIVALLERVFILRVIVDRVAVAFLLRLLLFVWGFLWINEEWADYEPGTTPSFKVMPGHVIYANHVSYIELLWLAFRYAPVFTALPLNATDGKVHVVSLWQAVTLTWSNAQPTTPAEPLSAVVEGAQRRLRPVVVFPEGTTTNGSILLALAPVLQGLSTQAHVMCFKFGSPDFSPAFSFGIWWHHLFLLCAQLMSSMTVRFLPDQDLPKRDKGDLVWESSMQAALATLVDQPICAKLNAADKQEFLRYWAQSRKTPTKTD